MTILSLDPSACSLLATDDRPAKIGARPVPRINLRKRPVQENDFAIPNVTSAFLSSLFSEVSRGSSKRTSGDFLESTSKKPRTCQSFQSFANLDSLAGRESFSPVTTNTAFFDQDAYRGISKQQVNVVSSGNASDIVFPNLPPTVSDPSCSRTNLSPPADQQPSVTGTCPTDDEDKDTYGWFVVVDSDDEDIQDKHQAVVNPEVPKDLAFCVPTAPKPTVQDDVKWAQAADTVDDVLADFF